MYFFKVHFYGTEYLKKHLAASGEKAIQGDGGNPDKKDVMN